MYFVYSPGKKGTCCFYEHIKTIKGIHTPPTNSYFLSESQNFEEIKS
jgi:hypothetical protein